MAQLEKVKTAVVGCGMISNIYIRNLKNLFSIIDLVALCDASTAAATSKAQIYGIEKVMTLDEIAEDEAIELVINLTPPSIHYSVIRKMLLAGKHVFTEKLFTSNLEEARELTDLANEKGLYLGVAPDTILGAGIQTARKMIDTGMIGEVTSCIAAINRNQSLNSESFRFLQKEGGDLPSDVGVYYVAALLALLGPIESVFAYGSDAPQHVKELLFQDDNPDQWTIPGKNLISGVLRFKSGVVGSVLFDGNTTNSSEHLLTIYGTEGILKVGDPNCFNGTITLIKPESDPCQMPFTHGYNGAVVLPDPTQFEYGYGHRGVGAAEMAWAIRRKRPNRCSKELGLHTMEVIKGFEFSAQTGEVVTPQSDFVCRPLRSGCYSTSGNGAMRADAEYSLIE